MAFIQLPSIVVEAALLPANPVTGASTLILDDAVFGLLDTDTLAPGDAWTDITMWMRAFNISRSSSRTQGPLLSYSAGSASITLDNSDGRFDPNNLSGPYVVSGVSQIRPMVPVRIRMSYGSVSAILFRGFADSWQESETSFIGGLSDWTLSASDGFKVLSGRNLAELITSVGANETTGSRINRVLDAAGWYTGSGDGSRKIAVGDSILQATSFGSNALDLMQIATDSEIGQLYIDGSGAVVFRNRRQLTTNARSVTSQAVFGDLPDGVNELECTAIARADDDTTIANVVQATRAGGTLQEVSDPASIGRYLFPRTYSSSDLLLTVDPDVADWAGWVLYISKNDENRIESISVNPFNDPDSLWNKILTLEMTDKITVVRRPPNADVIHRDCFVSSITHDFETTNYTWTTTYGLQDASKYGSFLALDNSTLGKLDENALIF